MPSISNTVHIDAPPERVWEATVDIERWPEFVPTFTQVRRTDSGALGAGKSARVTPKGFVGSLWTVTWFDGGRSFTWESAALPGLHFIGSHTVDAEDDGTRLTLNLVVSGWLGALLSPITSATFRRNLKIEADSFKMFCETNQP